MQDLEQFYRRFHHQNHPRTILVTQKCEFATSVNVGFTPSSVQESLGLDSMCLEEKLGGQLNLACLVRRGSYDSKGSWVTQISVGKPKVDIIKRIEELAS